VPVTRAGPSGNAGGGSTENWPKCQKCGRPADPSLPFCGNCAAPRNAVVGECANCGAGFVKGTDLFCNKCGTRVGQRVSVLTHAQSGGGLALSVEGRAPRIAILDERGEPTKVLMLDRGEAVIGRGDADIKFDADVYLSPLHARIDLDDGKLWLRDLGSRNGSWVFIEQATKLVDGDLILIGSQMLRFRRLGYPGPHPPEADSTRRMGSMTPNVDVAILEQLRADGSVRDVLHLSPGRNALIGRETGDWVFPYDQTMSARHAEIVSEDIEFFVHDAGSRNGVAMSVRGDRELKAGQRFLLGDQILRVENL
jgi:pSer/pThr/pTyr-binding forkhead associated (FHA) protein